MTSRYRARGHHAVIARPTQEVRGNDDCHFRYLAAPSFIGIGRPGRSDVSERIDELWEERGPAPRRHWRMILADTGPLYAAADASDGHHEEASAFFRQNREPVLVPVTVLPEVCYFIGRELGPEAEIRFMRSFLQGELLLEPVTDGDLPRCVELMQQYAGVLLGLVDASVIALAERLNIVRILTP